MELPDQMPNGCNFYGLLRTALATEVIAQRFATAGWIVSRSGGDECVQMSWGKLALTSGRPIVARGWLDRPDDHVGELLGLLGDGVYQWINAEGQLWRDLPFDESMLDLDDPRLPADIKASLRANLGSAKAYKPWWRFW